MQRKLKRAINQERIIDQIRCLGIDMIDAAGSGHPGIVLGAAPIIYTLYAHHLRFDPSHPDYFNRDRFVLSAGHGSALLYATLYMAGFPVDLDDLKQFRQLGSITPGHPEYGVTPGVDMSTGPLGQGIASAVGMAMAEASLEARYTKGKKKVIDYYTYVLCGDGDLMEGVSYEALSLAGTLKLNKLILLYDSNDICLDGSVSLTFRENIAMRFMAMGFNVLTVSEGESYTAISKAIAEAKNSLDKPTIIIIKTVIGKYSSLQGTNLVHGGALDREEITKLKETLRFRDIPFSTSKDTRGGFRYLIDRRCRGLYEDFNDLIEGLSKEEKKELSYFMNIDKKLDSVELVYNPPRDAIESPRVTSSKLLNSFVLKYPFIMGGSADLFAACKNFIFDGGVFSSDDYMGKNIYFGVREHAMGAILNGMALCGFRPYGSTFLAFSDYMRPAIRMACMMNLPITYIFTHDSISVGEDGPTHQPVEQLVSLRSMPNLSVYRPADANEVIGVYKAILKRNSGPAAICLSRNSLPILDSTKISEVEKGGYVVFDTLKRADGIVIATGEEVHLAIDVAKNLRVKGIEIRVVSMPNLGLFLQQSDEYIEEVLPVEIRKIVIEAASSFSWNRLVFNSKYLITLDQFGLSGRKDDVYKKYRFDVRSLEKRIEKLLK